MRVVLASLPALALASCGRISFDERTDSASPLPGIRIEAESGQVTPNFAIEEDAQQPGVFYVIDNNAFGTPGPGRVDFTVTIDTTATYYLWARAKAMSTSADSFDVTVDSGAPLSFFPAECIYGQGYRWGGLRTPTFCPTLDPLIGLPLATGDHSLALESREGGSLVDQLLLIDDVSYAPTD